MSLVIFFCLMTFSISNAQVPTRIGRQTITGELATGLTNTGTSFNTLYEGQDLSESYLGYQPQQAVNSYDPFQNNRGIGFNNYGSYGLSKSYGNGYGYGYGNGYGNGIGSGIGNGYGTAGSSWRGFGAGKNPYGVRSNPLPQYGLKY